MDVKRETREENENKDEYRARVTAFLKLCHLTARQVEVITERTTKKM